MANWTTVSESEYPWEQEALEFVRKGLPSSSPIQAWSNFEFMAEGGAIYEVDLLLIGPWGAFLIEIKSRPGVISSHAGSWKWRDGTKYSTRDNPLPLANRKAKALKSLLARQKGFKKIDVPFIEPLIFCSHESNTLELSGPQKNGVCIRDDKGKGISGILGAIMRRDSPGLKQFQGSPISKKQIRSFCSGIKDASLRPIQRTRRAGDYVLDKLFYDSPFGTYQEWLGKHVRIKSGPRLIRVYLEGLQGETERAIIKKAAEKEFQILEFIEHPGILRVDTLSETESGPALIFRWQEGAKRLDHYLAGLSEPLTADVSLEILRQITEAIAYSHRKKVVHRGLSPQSIIVLPDEENGVPKIQITNWQLGFIGAGTNSPTQTRLSSSLHAGQFIEEESCVFLAPEAFSGHNMEGEELDSFSIGALAYYLFSGVPPAGSLLDLDQKLRQNGYLDICSVQNGVVSELSSLIQHTACSDRSLRFSPEEILEEIDKIWDAFTAPDSSKLVDPRIAKTGDLLQHGFKVVRVLGSGSCSKVLLVDNQEEERLVLKVASKQEYSDRLQQEFETIKKIRHSNVIEVFEGFSFEGATGFTMEPAFSFRLPSDSGDETKRKESSLARRLREDGPLDLSLLKRFGVELLRTIDELERLGISHRDIKPDNLGIRSFKKGPLQLVLFDFSLANSPAEDIRLGTPPYLDPFLPLRKTQRWDQHAERFGAAMTLHEMACGAGIFPRWDEKGSAPHLIENEVNLNLDLFPREVKEQMGHFFEKAFSRQIEDRFDNTEEMLDSWRIIFDEIDQTSVKTDSAEDDALQESRNEIIATATPDTQLVLLGISARLSNVLERLEIVTISDLLRSPIGRFQRLRGVGYKTSREVLALYKELRLKFPDLESQERISKAGEERGEEAPEHASVDLIAKQLLTSAGAKDSGERSVIEKFLGWKLVHDDPHALIWLSQSDLGEEYNVSRARVGQVITKAREKWVRNSSLTKLREAIHQTLLSLGGVGTHEELIRLMLLLRGSTLSDPDSVRMASISTRAAVEAERQLKRPRFLESRRKGSLLIAVDPSLAPFALRLGEVGEELAGREPLPTASRVIETLGWIAFPDPELENLRPPDQARRAHLAASVSGAVCVNSRLELYPPNLSAERALTLSRSALFGSRELSLEEIQNRVFSRYPEAEPLPGRPALDRLLEKIGFPLRWDDEAADGHGAYQSKHVGLTTGSTYTIGSRAETIHKRPVGETVSDEIAEAQRIEEKLVRSRKEGSYLVLSIAPKYLNDATEQLKRVGAEHISANQLFLDSMKETAAKAGVNWQVVLLADSADKESTNWSRLQRMVNEAMKKIIGELRQSDKDILLTDAGLFARYGRMNEIDSLRNDSGTQSGPHSLWVLIPSHGSTLRPTLCGEALPISNEAQFEQLTPEWARNFHRGKAQ